MCAKRTMTLQEAQKFSDRLFGQVEQLIKSEKCLEIVEKLCAVIVQFVVWREEALKLDRMIPDDRRREFTDSLIGDTLDRERWRLTLAYFESLNAATDPDFDPMGPVLEIFGEIVEVSQRLATGRQSKDELWEKAHQMKKRGKSRQMIANKLMPDPARPDLAAQRVRKGVSRWKQRREAPSSRSGNG